MKHHVLVDVHELIVAVASVESPGLLETVVLEERNIEGDMVLAMRPWKEVLVAALVDMDTVAVIEFGDLDLDLVRLLEKVDHRVSVLVCHMIVKLSFFRVYLQELCRNYPSTATRFDTLKDRQAFAMQSQNFMIAGTSGRASPTGSHFLPSS